MAQQDIFLKVETTRAGALRGESTDPNHVGEIALVDWSWGMVSRTEAGSFQATGRAQVQPLRFVKRADAASTALMSALRSNDPVKKAVLTMQKSGGTSSVVYFVMTLERGRILSYDVRSERDEKGLPCVLEVFTMGFNRITVEYRGQDARGGGTAVSTYTDEISTDT
jgi:type VI secretion system secreted protein Hcp